MKNKMLFWNIVLGMATAASGSMVAAQVETVVPPPVANAKSVSVEHIKIHGKSLEGNLEVDAFDRDVIVFLPPQLQHKQES